MTIEGGDTMDYTNYLPMIEMQLDDAVETLTREQFKELADAIRESLSKYENESKLK